MRKTLIKTNIFQWVAEARHVTAAGTRSPFPKKRWKTFGKPILSDDTRYTENPVRSSGVPRALVGTWLPAREHAESHWEMKENEGSHEAPKCFLRGVLIAM